jgi:DNA-binding MarR family transcriptional regulator
VSGATEAAAALADLRRAFIELMGAERRLRSRRQAEGQLTFGHMRALHLLGEQERATAGELAKAADLNPASMTAMLDQLERDDIVRRERSETDRRIVDVTLTKNGRALLTRHRTAWEARWQEAVGDLPDADLEAALRVMRRIAAMLDDVEPS